MVCRPARTWNYCLLITEYFIYLNTLSADSCTVIFAKHFDANNLIAAHSSRFMKRKNCAFLAKKLTLNTYFSQHVFLNLLPQIRCSFKSDDNIVCFKAKIKYHECFTYLSSKNWLSFLLWWWLSVFEMLPLVDPVIVSVRLMLWFSTALIILKMSIPLCRKAIRENANTAR